LGYNVGAAADTTIVGRPAETIVGYAPGKLAEAERLGADLSGSFVYAERATPQGADLVLTAGTGLGVGGYSGGASAGRAGAALGGASGGANSIGQTTSAESALASFDPTACSKG
ncbi:MAG: hypothetical protein ACRD1G_17375, partial [Acidimicrobiales bacterium]